MMELRMGKHIVEGRDIVEIWDGDMLRGAIYPTEDGIKIHSKYFPEIAHRPEFVGTLQQDKITFLVKLK